MRPPISPWLVFLLGCFLSVSAGFGWHAEPLTPDAILVAGSIILAASLLMKPTR